MCGSAVVSQRILKQSELLANYPGVKNLDSNQLLGSKVGELLCRHLQVHFAIHFMYFHYIVKFQMWIQHVFFSGGLHLRPAHSHPVAQLQSPICLTSSLISFSLLHGHFKENQTLSLNNRPRFRNDFADVLCMFLFKFNSSVYMCGSAAVFQRIQSLLFLAAG